MNFSKGQGWPVGASGEGMCAPTWEHREYYPRVPHLFSRSGVGLHQPSHGTQTHPSVAARPRAVSRVPWKLSWQAHCFHTNQRSWVKEKPLLTSWCKISVGACSRWPQSQATLVQQGRWGERKPSSLFPLLCQKESSFQNVLRLNVFV